MAKPITINYQWPLVSYFVIVFFIITFVLAVINFVTAIKMHYIVRADSEMGKAVMTFKLSLLPFFIINFILWMMFTLGTFNPFMMALWIFIPLGVAYTYMILLVTSTYAILHIINLQCLGLFTAKQTFIHSVCQLIFIIDIIDYWYVYKTTKISM